MKTPIKLPAKEFKSLSAIKSIIPPGSYVHSFLLYNAGIEIPLSSDGRYVIAHTNKYSIYEFWTCLSMNPEQVQKVAEHFDNIGDKNIFHLLQETLPNYPDPYLRAGVFFLLNKYSKSGYVSRGEFDPDSHNPLAMANLRKVSFENFMVVHNKNDDVIESMRNINTRCDYVFVPVGDFSLNFLKNKETEVNSLSYDQTFIDTRGIREYMQTTDKKVILLYHYNKSVIDFFEKQNKYLIDQWGRITNNKSRAKEVIVANF